MLVLRSYIMRCLVFIVAFFVVGCHYRQDRLLIQNDAGEKICCEILIKNKSSSVYYEVAANLEIETNKSAHPISRSSISAELKNNSADSILYIIFHNCDDREYIFNNIDSIVFDKRFNVSKYSHSKLDSLSWRIKSNWNVRKK